MTYLSQFIKTKFFRSLDQDAKVVTLILISEANACGITSIDLDLLEFVSKCEDSKGVLQKLTSSSVATMDEATDELIFTDYMRYHNPFTGTRSHEVKYRADALSIKSDKIREIVKNSAGLAKTITKDNTPVKAVASSPRVDK